MDCKVIKRIMPDYVAHVAAEEDARSVEEHLCICQECRDYLSGLLDKKDSQPAPSAHQEEPLVSPVSPERPPVTTRDSVPEHTQPDLITYIIVGIGAVIVIGLLILAF